VGHNPLGGVSVIVMLVLILFQIGTGLFATDDILWTGPYNGAVSSDLAEKLTSLHHLNINIIYVALALHIMAVAFYFLVKKQNLVGAMFHGRKPAAHVPEHEAITKSEIVKALIVIVISAALVYWLVAAAPEPPDVSFN
jgi:cytochrome b